MADFCLECTEYLFGEHPSDFHGCISEGEFEDGFLVSVLCEGCGQIWVDHLGRRVEMPEEKDDNER